MSAEPVVAKPADLPDPQRWLPLLREALERQARFRWQLQGSSMLPTLRPGWEIEIVPLPPRVALGSLIVFAEGPDLVAHRLIRKTAGHWLAQGDNRPSPDRRLPIAISPAEEGQGIRPGHEPAPEAVLGLVAAAYDGDHCVWPRRRWLEPAWLLRAYARAALRRLR